MTRSIAKLSVALFLFAAVVAVGAVRADEGKEGKCTLNAKPDSPTGRACAKGGRAEAKKVMDVARNAAAEAPKEVPAVLKDDKADPYLKANLAVGFARGLTAGRVYEESLAAISGIKPEQTVDPAAYFFYRAVAEHALMKKDDAMRTIVRLLDERKR